MVSKCLPMSTKIVLPSQILIFSGHVTVRESLNTQGWVNIILDLDYIDTKAFSPRYEDSFMVYRPDRY